LNFDRSHLVKLLKASKVTVDEIYSQQDVFKGEDGAIFAQVLIVSPEKRKMRERPRRTRRREGELR